MRSRIIIMLAAASILLVINIEAGQTDWNQFRSSPVVGDEKIYVSSARGVVVFFAPGDTLKVLAQNDLKERIMATPAIVDGKIYVRTEKNLYAFGLNE